MDTRSDLLAAALSLFAARGYDAVGVQEIVDAAGVTKPTLYHYFGSKRGLLDVVLAEGSLPLEQELAQATIYAHDLPLTLDRIVGACFGFATAHPDFYRMELALWFAPPDSEGFRSIARLNEAQQARIEDLFVAASRDHGNMRGRQQAYAATFLGMVNTYVGLALNGYATLDAALRRQAVHQFMHGIFS